MTNQGQDGTGNIATDDGGGIDGMGTVDSNLDATGIDGTDSGTGVSRANSDDK